MYIDPSGESVTIYIILAVIGVIVASTIEYADAADLTLVTDISLALPLNIPITGVSSIVGARVPFPSGIKIGLSTVFAFSDENNERIEFYPHAGYYYGYTLGISTEIGIVENYLVEGDYKGSFSNVSFGYVLGFDHSYNPFDSYQNTVKSTSITFNTGFNIYTGFDYYIYARPFTIRLG